MKVIAMVDTHSLEHGALKKGRGSRFLRLLLKIVAGLVALIILGALGLRLAFFAEPAPAPERIAANAITWQTSIAAISDLDQAAAGYANGQLGLLPGQSDQIAILAGPQPATTATVAVSNSVIGWPTTARASRDGRFLYVVEIRGQAPPGTQSITQPYVNFPKGNVLTVIDTADRSAPRAILRLPVGLNPSSVDVSADGAWLAVASDEATTGLFLWRLRDGLPVGEPQRFDIPFPRIGARLGLRSLRFHPQLPFLAINLSDQQVAFYRLKHDGERARLTLHGQPVAPQLPNMVLTEVEWTPNGRNLLVPDVGWGDQSTPKMLTAKPGHLVSINFDGEATARHRIANIATVGRSPEAMEISPDGRFAITVNMERTYLPDMAVLRWIFGGSTAGSLSLITINPDGKLSAAPPVRFNALLPEDALFDTDSRTLALAVYERPSKADGQGYVEFWRIAGDGPSARLVRGDHVARVARGVHDLERLAVP